MFRSWKETSFPLLSLGYKIGSLPWCLQHQNFDYWTFYLNMAGKSNGKAFRHMLKQTEMSI